MASPSDKIIELRNLLATRFGQAPVATGDVYPTGLPVLDEKSIPKAALTEIVSSATAGPGGGLLLYGLLHAALGKGGRVILIDGKSSFAPQGLPQAELNRLLWMRCRETGEAFKAADLAVRDGNVPLVILFLLLNPPREMGRIPATAWHRLQMLCEKSAVTLLVFTAQAQVGCARLRLSAGGAFPLENLHRCREELLPEIRVNIERRRMSERRADEELRRDVCA